MAELKSQKMEGFCLSIIEGLNASDAARENDIVWIKNTKKYYIYFLIDPILDMIFYVGKGTGNRIKSHVRNANSINIDNAPKTSRIRSILDAGDKPVEVMVFDTNSEDEAYRVERMFIQSLAEHGLTNIVNGVVTNKEKALIRAKTLLTKIRPFDEWLRLINRNGIIKTVEKLGGPERFYSEYTENINRIIMKTQESMV